MTDESSNLFNIALTPSGVLYAFSQQVPDAIQTKLQSILSSKALPSVLDWLNHDTEHHALLERGFSEGWIQRVQRDLRAPDVKLDEFLSHVIAGLSGERRVALASTGGFCIGHSGYTLVEAEALCVAAADFTEFAGRQRARGDHHPRGRPTQRGGWFAEQPHCLVIAGEPLLNNPVFVELVWGIKTAGERFAK